MSGEQTVVIVDAARSVETPEEKPKKRLSSKDKKPPSEWKKTPRLKAVKGREPEFIGKLELARNLCCHIQTINKWIYKGTLPPPHSQPGRNHPVWLRRHYHAYVKTGRWPDEAWPSRRKEASLEG